ncbi:MAG: OadG family protein [Clostridia bacterium]|nr:OadG family protein [Clostridia bacterium]
MLNTISLLISKTDVNKALEIMWKGLVAIFVVIALVIIVTVLVNKLCLYFEKKAKERAEAKAAEEAENSEQ